MGNRSCAPTDSRLWNQRGEVRRPVYSVTVSLSGKREIGTEAKPLIEHLKTSDHDVSGAHKSSGRPANY
jgi:hypothetical protein